MLKRIITSLVAICVLIPVLILDDTWVFPIAVAIFATLGIYEMAGCIGYKKNLFLTVPFCIAAAFFPVYLRYSLINGIALFDILKLSVGLTFLFALYVFGVAVFGHKTVGITDAGLFFATGFYIIAAFSSLVYIHDFVPSGKYIYLLTFICAWTTDIFAYFTGRLLGKHKLIPAVSPKKTVEGAVGGIVFCVIALIVFGLVIESFFSPSEDADYIIIAISGIFISVVSQIGDLVMSVIKRHYGIKDYGKIFPGHGGVLDRFDSVLAVSLILAFICTYFNFFA